MSLNNSSFNGLRNFVNTLNEDTAKAIDPYNTFECYFTFVVPDTKKYFLKNFKNFLIKNIYIGNNIELHKYIEELKLPDVITDGGSTPLLHGKYNLTTTLPIPVDNKFTVSFINLMPNPIIETMMYPWMQAVAGVGFINKDVGAANDLDYPRADFTVTFPHLTLFGINAGAYPKYTYHNARPINIQTYNPSNKPATSMYREVQFAFDYFSISYKKK